MERLRIHIEWGTHGKMKMNVCGGLKGGFELDFTWRRPSGIIQLKGVVLYILNII
jgi:hypothetical protein